MAFKNHIEQMLMNSEFADVTFSVDGEKIPGHRIVLALSCPHFKTMFHGGLPESQSKVISLTNTSAKQFKEVLRYCYLGRIEVADWKMEELLDLLSLAREYQLNILVARVAIVLDEQPLDFGSWDMMNAAAMTSDLEILKSKCMAFAEKNVDSFLEAENVQLFSPSLVNALLETTKAATVDQTKLVKAISQWKRDKTETEIRDALSKLNWEKVSRKVMASFMKEVIHQVDFGTLKCWDDVSKVENQAASCSCQKAVHLDSSTYKFWKGFHDVKEFGGQVLPKYTTKVEIPEGSDLVFREDVIKLYSGKEQQFLCHYPAGKIRWKLENSNVTLGFVNGECKMTGFKWESHEATDVIRVEVCDKFVLNARKIGSFNKWCTYSITLPETTCMDRFCIVLRKTRRPRDYTQLRNVEVFAISNQP